MSKYRVKHFVSESLEDIENGVNHFIKENTIEVLKYRLMPLETPLKYTFIGILDYEVEDDQ